MLANQGQWNIVPHRSVPNLSTMTGPEVKSKEDRAKIRDIICKLVSHTNRSTEHQFISEFEDKLSGYPLDVLESLDSHLGQLFSQKVTTHNFYQDVIQNDHRQDIIYSLLTVPVGQWKEILEQARSLIRPMESSHDYCWAIQELCRIRDPEFRKRVIEFASDRCQKSFSTQLCARILSSIANLTEYEFHTLENDENEAKNSINKTMELYKKETGKTR